MDITYSFVRPNYLIKKQNLSVKKTFGNGSSYNSCINCLYYLNNAVEPVYTVDTFRANERVRFGHAYFVKIVCMKFVTISRNAQ